MTGGWSAPKPSKPIASARLLGRYVGYFEAKRLERAAVQGGKGLEIYSVRPHTDDVIRDGSRDARYDVWEVEGGGIRWIEPSNFYDWPNGSHTEHRNAPWTACTPDKAHEPMPDGENHLTP